MANVKKVENNTINITLYKPTPNPVEHKKENDLNENEIQINRSEIAKWTMVLVRYYKDF